MDILIFARHDNVSPSELSSASVFLILWNVEFSEKTYFCEICPKYEWLFWMLGCRVQAT